MIRRPPRSTQSRSSAASDVYKRQVPHRISRADAGIVRAPGPAMVVGVNVKAGDHVSAGDRLAVLESMKMELAVTAPFSGTIRHVMVMANAQVGAGTPLLHVDAARDESGDEEGLSLIHISEPTRLGMISYAVFCL